MTNDPKDRYVLAKVSSPPAPNSPSPSTRRLPRRDGVLRPRRRLRAPGHPELRDARLPFANGGGPVTSWETSERVLESGGFESRQRVLVGEPVVEASEAGACTLGVTHRQAVDRHLMAASARAGRAAEAS